MVKRQFWNGPFLLSLQFEHKVKDIYQWHEVDEYEILGGHSCGNISISVFHKKHAACMFIAPDVKKPSIRELELVIKRKKKSSAGTKLSRRH